MQAAILRLTGESDMPEQTTTPDLAPPARTGRIELRVRYHECDPMGVAHHSAFPVWFEMGRTELYRESGGAYRELEATGAYLAVVRLNVRYRAPARYDDVLSLETSLTGATRVKLEHSYRLLRDGQIIATGETTLACVDDSGRLRALPGHLQADE
jgi:acyl-CoA thioester hydrolase